MSKREMELSIYENSYFCERNFMLKAAQNSLFRRVLGLLIFR